MRSEGGLSNCTNGPKSPDGDGDVTDGAAAEQSSTGCGVTAVLGGRRRLCAFGCVGSFRVERAAGCRGLHLRRYVGIVELSGNIGAVLGGEFDLDRHESISPSS